MKSLLPALAMLLLMVQGAFGGANGGFVTELPIPAGAVDVKRFTDRPAKGVNSITYKVATPFPAAEVTRALDHQMQQRGFQRYRDPYQPHPSFSWVTPSSTAGEWEKTNTVPARYTGAWANKKNDEIVWVVIAYAPYPGVSDWQRTARVSCQIARFSQFKKEFEEVKDRMRK